MFVRSEVRYNCYCKKKGNKPKNQHVVDVIQSQLADGYTWSNFADKWDVVVTPKSITVIPNVTDIAKVMEVCIQASVYARKGLSFDFEDDEERAICDMIEAHFLEGKMNWKNFRTHWNIRWNSERNRVETYLTDLPASQRLVTEEMIQAQINKHLEESSVPLTIEVSRKLTAAEMQALMAKGE